MAQKYVHRFFVLLMVLPIFISCQKEEDKINNNPVLIDTNNYFDINQITDTYAQLASAEQVYSWGPYNVHDPSIIKSDEYYYAYSTDAAYGTEIQAGIQIRKSKDLIQWSFIGWVFNGIPSKGASFISSEGGTPNEGLWAPYILKVGNEYRLYYSLASNLPRLSCIGLATADSPIGPWTEKGIVVRSFDSSETHTNAIDPSVLIDKEGRHWMYYGSSWDGIYLMELNPTTGLALNSGDKGVRIAHRGFTGNTINGNIEGAEIIYNPDFDKYYLFIAYDWLETKYNVRVSRSDSPEGPFLDMDGNDINDYSDNSPMIIAPYQFEGHSGWQGVSHPSVFNDGNGQFYISHQGRPGIDHYFMVMHNRKLHWTEEGWPIASPERYAGVEQVPVSSDELVGDYEMITFNYNVVPGFAETQTSPDFQQSVDVSLSADGTINGGSCCTWTYESPWLTLSWGSGIVEKFHVEWGRDWENNVETTLLLTGFNNHGTAVWGKKID